MSDCAGGKLNRKMDSEIHSSGRAQEAGRSSLHEVLAALEEMERQSQADYPDETVQWAINELSDEGHAYLFGPRRRVLDAYKAWKAANDQAQAQPPSAASERKGNDE